MPLDFFLAEAEKASRIVVEDIALLFGAQEGCLLDRLNGYLDGSRPGHLVGTPHDSLFEPGIDQPLELGIEILPGQVPIVARDIHVHLRVGE